MSQLSEDITARLVVDGTAYRESFGSYASLSRNMNMNNGMLERDLVLSLEVNTESGTTTTTPKHDGSMDHFDVIVVYSLFRRHHAVLSDILILWGYFLHIYIRVQHKGRTCSHLMLNRFYIALVAYSHASLEAQYIPCVTFRRREGNVVRFRFRHCHRTRVQYLSHKVQAAVSHESPPFVDVQYQPQG